MPLKSVLLLMSFVAACGGALYFPLIGVVGYVLHYHVGPEKQWWATAIAHWGIRYSLMLAGCTAIGFVLRYRHWRFGRKALMGQEWLMIAFVAVVWLSVAIGTPAAAELFGSVDPPQVKMTKVVVFALILTHVATTRRAVDAVFWTMVVGVIFLGYQAYSAGPAMYKPGGRLDNIGGPDFRDANTFATHLAACLPIIGIQFMRSRWPGKLLCAVSGVLAVNAIVLTRSRGAVVACVAGLAVFLTLAPKAYRKRVAVGVILALIGGYMLTDPGFWKRARTIAAAGSEQDSAITSRLEIWEASLQMVADHPQGVGARGFPRMIGKYAPEHASRDAHSAFLLCLSELGVHGLALLAALVLTAGRILRRVYRQSRYLPKADRDALGWMSYALAASGAAYLVGSLTVSTLYAEGLWWFLALPICLERSVQNARPAAASKARPPRRLSAE